MAVIQKQLQRSWARAIVLAMQREDGVLERLQQQNSAGLGTTGGEEAKE